MWYASAGAALRSLPWAIRSIFNWGRCCARWEPCGSATKWKPKRSSSRATLPPFKRSGHRQDRRSCPEVKRILETTEVLDIAFREDGSRVRTGYADHNLAQPVEKDLNVSSRTKIAVLFTLTE